MEINFLALDVGLIGKKPKTPHATSSLKELSPLP